MLRSVPHIVPRAGRSYEHIPDGFELNRLISPYPTPALLWEPLWGVFDSLGCVTLERWPGRTCWILLGRRSVMLKMRTTCLIRNNPGVHAET